MLSDSLAVYETMISNRLAATSNELNVIMKKLTALTIIIMIPTLIAGIYGMNFLNMPELRQEFGYYGALAVMLITGLITYYAFHQRDWI
jgi:magnesium transporter